MTRQQQPANAVCPVTAARELTQFAQNCSTSSGWFIATALFKSCRMAAYIGERAIVPRKQLSMKNSRT